MIKHPYYLGLKLPRPTNGVWPHSHNNIPFAKPTKGSKLKKTDASAHFIPFVINSNERKSIIHSMVNKMC